MAKYQNEFQRELWNENNAYNTPAAQMSRFKEAGLNPHLIYGKGTSGNATMSTAARVQPADARLSAPVNLSDALNQYYQTRLLKARAGQEEAKEKRDQWLYGSGHEVGIYRDGKLVGSKKIMPFAAYYLKGMSLREEQVRKVQNEYDLITKRIDNVNANTEWVKNRRDYQNIVNRLAKAGLSMNDPAELRLAYSIMTNEGKESLGPLSKTTMATYLAILRGLQNTGLQRMLNGPRNSNRITGQGKRIPSRRVSQNAVKAPYYDTKRFRGYSYDQTMDNWK